MKNQKSHKEKMDVQKKVKKFVDWHS